MGTVERIYDWLIRHPSLAVAGSVVFALALASFVELEIDTRIEIWFLEDDPDVATYNEYVARFEADEFVVIAIEADDVFEPAVLLQVRELGARLVTLPNAISAHSLATAETFRLVDGTFEIAPLFVEPPTDAASRDAMRMRVRGDPLLSPLVAVGDRATIVLVEHTPFEDLRDKAAFAERARTITREVLGETPFRAAGNAFVEEALQDYTFRDLAILAPLTALAIFVITLALFRNIWCTVVPMLVIGLTLFSVIGLAGMFGVRLNIITTIVLPLAIAVGVADTVHLISGYRERLARGLDQAAAMRSAWLELLFPCVITTLTTGAGLASLVAANLVPIKQFGWMGAATVVFALIYTLVLTPTIFLWVKPPTPRVRTRASPMDRVLLAVADFSWRRSGWVLAATAALVVVSAIGLTRVQVGADFAAYFRDDDPLSIDSRFIDDHLGGTGSIDLMVTADDIRDPATLRAMERFQRFIEQNPAVLTTESPATLVATLHERYFDDPSRHRVPDSLEAVAQLLSQTEGTVTHDRLMLVDYSAGRVRGRVRSSEYRALVEGIDATEAEAAAAFDGIAEAKLTGLGKLIANLDRYIVESQIRSFMVAFVTVGVLLAVFFRSFHIGMWALVPNALPILMVLGVMGWSGILLDVGTVMVASIMLGLIVDDTVHYLARYRREYRAVGPRPTDEERRYCARATGLGTGRALTTTSLILACGFWVSLFASFQPNINFGAMCGAATLIALACDLIALPAVIRAFPLKQPPPRGAS